MAGLRCLLRVIRLTIKFLPAVRRLAGPWERRAMDAIPLFNIAGNSTSSGAGIMGYGVIDGRGDDKLLVNGTASANSWWDLASQARKAAGRKTTL